MRRIYTLFCLICITVATSAQKNVADSFLRVLRVQKTDSLQTQTLLSWMDARNNGLYDSTTYYPTQIIQTGQQQANTDVQALGHAQVGFYQNTHGNSSLALENFLKALKLGEARNNPRVMLRLYYFRSFYGDAKENIAFKQQVIQLAKQTGELNWEALANLETGNTYLNKLQQYDSALVYLQRAYEKAQQLASMGKLTFNDDIAAAVSLGYTFMKLNNPTLALAYFRVALQTSMGRNDAVVDRVYEGLATFYKETHNLDSSFYYAAKLYQLSEMRKAAYAMKRQVTASNLLYQIYKERGNADSALKYHEIFKATSDSVNSIAQAQKVESLLSQEKERQAELGLKKEKEEEARKHNLEYAAIALGMVALLICFLVLSHSVLANQKLIRFLGVVSLLIVFEFLNLLLHPWLGQVTHESPVLMLLIMVGLAAVLVPLHHKLEHWITHKLVEKNNKIRLAAAKKTIQQLEGDKLSAIKKILPLLLTFFLLKNAQAQTHEIDSLRQLLQKEKTNTGRVLLLTDLAYLVFESKPDTAMKLAIEGLEISRKIHYEKGEAASLLRIGSTYLVLGNLPKAMTNYLQALKINERIGNLYGQGRCINGIGVLYREQGNQRIALENFFKAKDIAEQIDDQKGLSIALVNISTAYQNLKVYDSATLFAQQAYNTASQINYARIAGNSLQYLGDIHLQTRQYNIAIEYLRSSFSLARAAGSDLNLATSYITAAKVFDSLGQKDSVLFYGKQAFRVAKQGNFTSEMRDAARLLSHYYRKYNADSAFYYQDIAKAMNDTLFSQEKQRDIQNLQFDEKMRQQEIAAKILQEEEDRKHNLQYAAIAVWIITFIILFFVFSRSIVVGQRFIRFFGIMGLLAVFEFINLYIHPHLAHITNDSPTLMLLILMGIGALLVPLHHKLEHWITHRVVEKNNKIRLAAAKKTIQQLEGQQTN